MPIVAPTRQDVHLFATHDDFRAWLKANHDAAGSLWVGYYKKAVPKAAMTYPQAVEEALCFGWIDGITYRIDDEITTTRFTPRRRTSSWSAVNIARVARLTAAGRMHPAGLRAFEERDRHKDGVHSSERPAVELPEGMMVRLQADTEAWKRWESELPSFRKAAGHWITSAKLAETQERRFGELLRALRSGSRPRPFLVERAARGQSGP
ncbi:MAG: YdeI/OmpD-associated family protein [Candidatus Limnocylindria bacterium]